MHNLAMDRRDRRWSKAISRVASQAQDLRRDVDELRSREARLEAEVAVLRQRLDAPPVAVDAAPGDRAERLGPVIHVYLANGQDFYGVVNSMDDESFSIAVSNSAGRVVIIPKKNILYYRMKY